MLRLGFRDGVRDGVRGQGYVMGNGKIENGEVDRHPYMVSVSYQI